MVRLNVDVVGRQRASQDVDKLRLNSILLVALSTYVKCGAMSCANGLVIARSRSLTHTAPSGAAIRQIDDSSNLLQCKHRQQFGMHLMHTLSSVAIYFISDIRFGAHIAIAFFSMAAPTVFYLSITCFQ